jgi:phosphoserine phosphatase RsbU/P
VTERGHKLEAADFGASVLSASPDSVTILSAEGAVLFMNARGVELNELDGVEEVLGKNYADIWPAEERDEVRAAIRGAAGGHSTSFEGFCPTTKGRPLWREVRFSPMPATAGESARILGISRDFSRRRQTEIALAETQERLDLALSHSPLIGTWVWRVAEDRVYADARFANMFGVEPAEAAVGAPIKSFLAGIHPDDAERVGAEIDKALRTGTPFASEYRLRTKDGDVRHVLARGQCFMSANGVPERFPGVIVDITERVAAEDRLRRLNEELERKVIERTQARGRTWQVSPDLLGALNSKGYFETSNPAWKTVLGWTEEEVASMSIFEMLHPDDVERTRDGFNLTQVGQPAIRFPNRYRCKEGGYRWISWVGIPEDGMVYCSGRDITEEKAGEVLLSDERGISALREQFIAVLGHDLRNPLGAIGAGVKMLRRTVLDAKAEQLVALMESSVNRMVGLIENVTDFARGRLGGGFALRLDPAETIKPVLDQVVSELQINNPDRVIVLDFGACEPVSCDHQRIGQLVSNLLGNAIAHGAPDKPIRIAATTAHGYLEISVANSGAQISDAVLKVIFQPFVRGEVLSTMQGLGLGLYISREIATAHGGTLEVMSTPVETRFTFRMPIR